MWSLLEVERNQRLFFSVASHSSETRRVHEQECGFVVFFSSIFSFSLSFFSFIFDMVHVR